MDQVHLLPPFSGLTTLSKYDLLLKISDCYILYKNLKIKCKNRPLATDLKDITGTYFLISADGTVTSAPVLEDTISELPHFQTTPIHGYDDQLLTHSPEKLEPYTMLEI